jgi:glycosyltransferase involved in cell wall biosynthesis
MVSEDPTQKGDSPGFRVSVCIIAKNEEFNIEFCLKSILPIAHEIIILDTGSTDKTREVVGAFHETHLRLYETEWQNDFSKARNECISYASGDWIFSIDADEFLTEFSQNNIMGLLKKRETEETKADIYNFHILPPETRATQPFFRATLFKNGKGIKFVRPIHEHLDLCGKDLFIVNCPLFTIQQIEKSHSHADYQRKEENYINLLKKIILENPDKKDNYFYYKHLGDSYSNLGQDENSLSAYYKSYQIYQQYSLEKKDRVFFTNLLVNMIRKLIFNFGNHKDALLLINELLDISDSTDGYSFLAFCKMSEGNYSEAIDIYKYTLELLVKKDPFGLNKDFYNYINEQIEKCREKVAGEKE